jgi:arginyl-tRNA--protein-N-Asp/Glu arginylyltransferase
MKFSEIKTPESSKRRTEITIETHSLTIIRMRNGKTDFRFCQECGEKVSVFALAHAAFIFRVQEKCLERLFESNEIHHANEAALCGNSLINYYNRFYESTHEQAEQNKK